MTIRYTGTWLRVDILLTAFVGCIFGAALWYGAALYFGSPHAHPPAATLLVLAVVPLLIAGYLVFAVARSITTIVRFRLQIDSKTVSYRGAVRESTYPHAQIDVLRWDPGFSYGRNNKPSYLLFKDQYGDVLFSVLGSLLSQAQLHEISEALHTPILDLPAH